MLVPPKGEKEKPTVEWVSERIIRRHFNDGQYHHRTTIGELNAIVMKDTEPQKLPSCEPLGTRSQIVFYYSLEGKLVAIVHQYLRPDGTIGASGKPDPKKLFLENRILAVRACQPQKA